ncbi:uncharacterized protein LOC121247256 [Juglans microcarpa x Juglans regia]|uniref:uncharacterized protein LOC121247256 n=1 Tax=Juglans microcarpa x Juglans regia TaxID=2249226 RepID=UPI001B7F6731|nr:uncharacterized protein LOC121247256 [Juglans microcarpa x Juglans regia]
MFTWRACSEALPTLSNLQKRKVVEDGHCPVCKTNIETLGHVLWGCCATRDIWGQGCKKIQKMLVHSMNFLGIWDQLVKNLQQDELEEAAMVARHIWTRRNEFVHGKEFRHPNSVLRRAREDLQLFRRTKQTQLTNSESHTVSINTWKKPLDGNYKLNWEEAIDDARGKISVGAILRTTRDWLLGLSELGNC